MHWYYYEDEVQIGPLTEEEWDELVKIGKITDQTIVWNESMAEWKPFRTLRAPVSSPTPTIVDAQSPVLHCSQCRRPFATDELIRYENSLICSDCKPYFFQRLKEGLGAPGALQYAGFWIRAGAKVVDFVILWVAEMAFMLALSPLIGFSIMNPQSSAPNLAFLAVYPFLIIFSFGYSVFFVGKYGATPGKMALGLKIVTSSGGPITYGKALGRMFAEMLSGLICYIGYIMVATNDEKKALHDQICDTRVIRK